MDDNCPVILFLFYLCFIESINFLVWLSSHLLVLPPLLNLKQVKDGLIDSSKISPSLSLSVYTYIYISLIHTLFLNIYPFIFLSFPLYLHLSLSPSFYLSIYISFFLSLSIYISISIIYLSMYLFIYLSFYLYCPVNDD